MADRYAGFVEFVDARGPALMRTASLLTRDRGHAEDAPQEALTKAALKWPSINIDGNPEPYVRQVLYTVVVDRWRWSSRRAREVAGEPADAALPSDSFADADRRLVVRDAIPTGYAQLQPSLQLASVTGRASVIPSRMAWSPDGQTFACICSFEGQSPQLVTADMAGDAGNDLTVGTVEETGTTPRQISWGTDGLVAQLDGMKAPWRLVPVGESAALADPKSWPPVESVSMLAPGMSGLLDFSYLVMGQSDQGGFLTRIRGGNFWVVTANSERTVVGNLGDRPILGALGESYFIVFTDWKGEPLNSEVTRVDFEGETTLTMLPPGATTISFASELVD